MSWITENAWPLILILGGAAAVMLILGESRLRTAAIVCVLAAVGVHFLEGAVVTPREQVELNLQKMLEGFIADDLNAVSQRISEKSPGLLETAKQGLDLVRLSDGFHMEDVDVKVDADGQSADVHLRANGSLIVRQSNTPYRAATRWRTKWVRESGDWKLLEVRRLDPVNGQEIGILDRQ